MTGCDYFRSDEWTHRVCEAARCWDLDDFAAKSGLPGDPDAFLETATDAVDEESADDLTLGDLPSSLRSQFDDEAVADAWVDRWNVADTCPHEAGDDGRCLFHRDPDVRDPAAVRSAFLEALEEPETSRFVGAKFGTLDLTEERFGVEFNHAIDLSYARFDDLRLRKATVGTELTCSFATVEGDLDCNTAAFGGDLTCIGLAVEGDAIFTHAEFDGRSRFLKSTVAGTAAFKYARFARGAHFDRATLERTVFRDADFEDVAMFRGTRFGDDADFRFVTFDSGVRFTGATFRKEADFHDSSFTRGATFEGATFHGPAKLKHVTMETGSSFSGTRFRSTAHLYNVTFGRYVSFEEAMFEDEVRFVRADFDGIGKFVDTTFEGTATFRDADISTLRFDGVTAERPVVFESATLEEGTVDCPTQETYLDVSEATLGDVRLRYGERNPFEFLRVRETEFDGFEFSDAVHRWHLKRNWALHDTRADAFDELDSGDADEEGSTATEADERLTPDTDYDSIENTYLKAKNGANEVGDGRASSAFFRREMKYRRKGHFAVARHGSGFERLVSAGRWCVNWLINVTCGYGERPEYTVFASFGTVVLFAGLFYASGVQFPTASEYLLVSIQSFVALILGELPASELGPLRLLTSLQAFIGAFFIGLFVFTLTRSIHR